MVEECQEVARINGNEIYEIKKVAMLDIDTQQQCQSKDSQYKDLVKGTLEYGHYFSFKHALTKTYQSMVL